MNEIEKKTIRKILIGLVALGYPVDVGICSFMKLNVPLSANVPWPEVFYGPAITVASMAIMVFGGAWISCRRGR